MIRMLTLLTEATVDRLACFFFDAIEWPSKGEKKWLGIINIPMATMLKGKVQHDCGQAFDENNELDRPA